MPQTVPSSAGTAQKRIWLTERRRSSLTAYLFISPFFVIFAIFGLYPIIFTLYLSLFRWDALGPMKYVGLQNFKFVVEDPIFWTSFTNTLLISAMGTIPQLMLALVLAAFLNSQITRFKKTFRVLYFMPNITSIVAVTLVFSALFSSGGMVNWFFGLLGVDPVNWTSGWWGVKIAIATMIMWRWTGYNTIIYLSGMQSIPTDLYEAARIDGANRWQIMTRITLPLLRPFVLFTVMMSTIGSLQLFTEPYVYLGQSGTSSTRSEGITMVIYLYTEAFSNSFFGTAAATAVILLFFTIIFSLINIAATRRIGGTDDGGGL
ncbi:cytochrome c biogenesis protein [Insulibacter thermoxylanivorax]|jgi:cellobiose transport system permease protein|uniref:Cytochrome c biogenesis protein n=1 Tax=Insulibacter thermoxylanivorax TaxID=2749268 RepID=A0A916QE73_9BACL|nr:sugar ABC transporter permease [Insulibacter thermoxylanivorax]GFR37964.1 cytochrome c biogenesis protein [Insulibacter thermoxylanivorax]